MGCSEVGRETGANRALWFAPRSQEVRARNPDQAALTQEPAQVRTSAPKAREIAATSLIVVSCLSHSGGGAGQPGFSGNRWGWLAGTLEESGEPAALRVLGSEG